MIELYSKSEKRMIDISVIAANYNNGRFLTDFFNSCCRSSANPKEWIFVDDGSTDNSMEIALLYSERLPNLKIIELGSNQGFAEALNIGIQAATGKYIARIDPDDIMLSERLEWQYDLLEKNNLDIVGGNAIFFHSSRVKDIWTTNFPLEHSEIIKTFLRGEHGLLHPTVMGRTSLFLDVPYIQKNVPAEDYDIFSRMAKKGARFANISKPVIRYRVHGKSVSNGVSLKTIRKTYELRDSIFGKQTAVWKVAIYFMHIRMYRKYLFSTSQGVRLMYLILAGILRPDKVVRKIRILVASI